MRATALSIAIAAAGLTHAAQAQTQFSIKQITLPGATSIDATAINDAGKIVGNDIDANGEHGFILQDGNVSLLPATGLPNCASAEIYPTAVNERDEEAGVYSCGDLFYIFTVKNGVYDYGYTGTSMGAPGSKHLWVGLAPGGDWKVAVNYYDGAGVYRAFFGKRAETYGRNRPIIRSVNGAGYYAGTATHNCGIDGHCVFMGKHKRLQIVYPSGAATASGGYINIAFQVAGVYATSIGGNYSGFVFDGRKNTYTTFNAPGTAYTMNVYGNNKHGRVVGIYAAQNSSQHGFLYNGTTATSFGEFAAGDTVTAAINDHGVIVVSDTNTSGSTSYRVTCSGSGC